ncbi:MAG: flagellar biosynthesis protein FlhF [Lachnospiraceae bacterium]|jgi:flagellar biosynthesis protein FlhF|nr:flagellar biosynthesis protein FlhF [Lachnospiraceae bacterium]
MVIKKFQGKTEAEATENARKELGSAVVIMNVRNVKKKGIAGIFKSPQVEVTVALEEESEKQPQKAPTMTALEQLAARQKAINDRRAAEAVSAVSARPSGIISEPSDDIIKESAPAKPLKDIMDDTPPKPRADVIEKLDSLENLLKNRLDATSPSDSEKDSDEKSDGADSGSEQMRFTKLLYNMMIDNEVHEKYAGAIIEEAEKTNKPGMPFDYMLTNIYQKMILKFGNPTVITPASRGPKVVYFVGPTGVGKTTTIAKIASKLCVEDKKKVALLTADTYRIAAAEQLHTYANILEVPFRIIYSPSEVEQAIEDYHEYDYILVDTAGHSHHNEEQRANTGLMVHAVDNIAECEVYLVLSATTKYRDLISIADTYKEMADYKIIFTKLDETTALGNLLNLRLYTGSELSYVTYGQNVPDDIDRFNPQTTVKSILGGSE